MTTWLGGDFSLTLGGLRLRVRIALEDVPPERSDHHVRVMRAHAPGATKRRG